MLRADRRRPDELRPVSIEPGFLKYAEGSALISLGNTRVLCAASVEDRVPMWMKGRGIGWVTAEYAMLPRATQERNQREVAKGRLGGRTHEIQRIIGRALRAVTDTAKLGERTIWLDCDVLQADGGTRTAAVTGAYVALELALRTRFDPSDRAKWPLQAMVAATSVGIVGGVPLLDLAYDEDSQALVDMNVFMTDAGRYVELQGTAEARPFDRRELDALLALAEVESGNSSTCSARPWTRTFMPVDEALRRLVTQVGAFHITDRAMRDAQRSIEAALRDGEAGDGARRAYYQAVSRYFEGFDREARAHLRDVDRRLERLNQVHFNYSAERGVAVKRIEATQALLHALAAARDSGA